MEHERHRGIELFRVMLMFGICLLHANSKCGHPSDLAINLLSPCVCGFAFISGWFGIKFSIGKFVHLICTGLYSGLVALALIWLFFPEYLTYDIAGIKLIHRVLFVRWFLLAYLVVMLIAPWINAAFDVFSDQEIKSLLIPMSILMLWNWASEIPYVSMAIPLPFGFGAYTPWTLVLIYVFGCFCRRLGLTRAYTGGGAKYMVALTMFMIIVLVSFPGWLFAVYSSPVAICFSGLLFAAFYVVPNRFVPQWIVWLGPSMFTVYLYHSHPVGYALMKSFEDALTGCLHSDALSKFLVAISVFALGVLIDLPRRIVASKVRRQL